MLKEAVDSLRTRVAARVGVRQLEGVQKPRGGIRANGDNGENRRHQESISLDGAG
jgi:hypothetical protein